MRLVFKLNHMTSMLLKMDTTQLPFVFYAVYTVLLSTPTYCLDCYHCSNIKNVSDCHSFTQCNQDEFCYTDATGAGTETRFALGCRPIQICRAAATTTISSLTIIGRDVQNKFGCSQCCDTDACNKRICITGIPATNSGTCQDDPNFDCQSVSSVFNICSDTYHAQLKCPKLCGFCDHPIVHGQWSTWQPWSSCGVTCGNGTKTRVRLCNDPAPQNGGLDCQGKGDDTDICYPRQCPIHGQWSRWSAWGLCSVSCGIGLERRDRTCSNPYPGPDGDPCSGDYRDDRACFTMACSDGGWSQWSSWGSCSQTCLGGLNKRTRTCNNPQPSVFGRDCVGNNVDTGVCNNVECPVTDGQWSSWDSWSNCSVTCNTGIKRRTRTCTNPAPSTGGLQCPGNSKEIDICNGVKCSYGSNTIRLVNGRLEVFYSNEWGTVCDDHFSTSAAKVVCRMLGRNTNNANVVGSALVPDGSGRIWLDDVVCSGTESSIFDCSHTLVGHHNCQHLEDVGVSCK